MRKHAALLRLGLLVLFALGSCSADDRASPNGTGANQAGGGASGAKGEGGSMGEQGGNGGSGSVKGGSGGASVGSGGARDDGGATLHELAISGQEAATRIAKVLWQSTPDAPLLERAKMLKTREEVHQLALNMLQDPRARAGVAAFYRWWLWLDKAEAHDQTRFPEWTSAVQADVTKAAEMFAVNVTLDMNGSFRTLMTGPFTYVNERLANFYGIPNVVGDDFQKVDLDPKQRGGLLTQPSLTARIYPGVLGPPGTNPPMRGRIILNRLYCTDLSPVHMPVIPPYPNLSTRQFYQTVTASVSGGVPCVSCHYGAELSVLGFAFEGFDDLGRPRTLDDRGHPVDLRGLVQNGSGAEAAFDGPVQLSAILADHGDVQTCFERQWSAFAHGLPSADSEQDTDGDIHAAFKASDLNLRELIAAVLSSESFLASAGARTDAGVGGRGGEGSNDAGTGSNDADTLVANCSVPAILSKHSCTGLCHAPAYATPAGGGFDMLTPGWENKLVGNGPSATAPETSACKGKGLNYLNRTQPATGLFLDKLKPNAPCGQAMPILAPKLSASDLACVQKWADALVANAP